MCQRKTQGSLGDIVRKPWMSLLPSGSIILFIWIIQDLERSKYSHCFSPHSKDWKIIDDAGSVLTSSTLWVWPKHKITLLKPFQKLSHCPAFTVNVFFIRKVLRLISQTLLQIRFQIIRTSMLHISGLSVSCNCFFIECDQALAKHLEPNLTPDYY